MGGDDSTAGVSENSSTAGVSIDSSAAGVSGDGCIWGMITCDGAVVVSEGCNAAGMSCHLHLAGAGLRNDPPATVGYSPRIALITGHVDTETHYQ